MIQWIYPYVIVTYDPMDVPLRDTCSDKRDQATSLYGGQLTFRWLIIHLCSAGTFKEDMTLRQDKTILKKNSALH